MQVTPRLWCFTTQQRGAIQALVDSLEELPLTAEDRETFLFNAAAACEHFESRAKDSLLAAFVASTMKQNVLEQLDPAIAYGETGQTVGEVLASARSAMEENRRLLGVDLSHSSEADRRWFFENTLVLGEVEAARRFLEVEERDAPTR